MVYKCLFYLVPMLQRDVYKILMHVFFWLICHSCGLNCWEEVLHCKKSKYVGFKKRVYLVIDLFCKVFLFAKM